MNRNDFLEHMNPYHDPETGKFTTSDGRSVVTFRKSAKSQKQIDKHNKKAFKYGNRMMDAGMMSKRMYQDAARQGINAALTGSRRSKLEAEKLFEYAVLYRDAVKRYAKKLEKMGVAVEGPAITDLTLHHKAVGEAFIKRSLAGQIGKSIITFGFGDSNPYKLDTNKILSLVKPQE